MTLKQPAAVRAVKLHRFDAYDGLNCSCMEESSAELNFSLPELEEAGLLQLPTCSDAATAATTQPSGARDWLNQEFLSYVNDAHRQHLDQSHAQHTVQLEKLADPSLNHIPDKRLANREYQKRFRAKQKVALITDRKSMQEPVSDSSNSPADKLETFELILSQARTQAVSDQLADATEELQKLRLQRQELEIKLGQTQAQLEARSQVHSLVDIAVLLLCVTTKRVRDA